MIELMPARCIGKQDLTNRLTCKFYKHSLASAVILSSIIHVVICAKQFTNAI
jgi:hypothetical protein